VVERGAGLIGALLEQRYRVDALLARGGMSSVYRGLDTRLERRVAIKVMDARFAEDKTFVDRFELEARAAAKIHHPNVVAVHDQGVDAREDGERHVYLVMELVDGGTLRDLITERGALPVPLALAIIDPVLTALGSAHRAGLVHRDVKPENVLIGHSGESGSTVKVGDFGLVRAVSSAGTTNSSVILGTVAYLSPEQVTTGTATARGDVYSTGIMLFEALTGGPPYTGDNALSIAYRHVNDDVPAPSTLVEGIPPALDELVLRATRRDPATRPADASAFLEELTALRTALGVPPVAVPVPEPTKADSTIPVSASDRARALEPPVAPAAPTTGAQAGVLDLAELGEVPLPDTPAGGNATVVRRAPAGFQAMGPQGTRAMLRTDLNRSAPPPPPLADEPTRPPMRPPHVPTQRPPGPMTGAQPALPPRRSNTGRIVLWSVIALLVLALVGTTTWWFASGRYETVPTVAGKSEVDATTLLADNDLKAKVVRERHNEVAAGTVIRTDPPAGKEMLRGDPVTVYVSSGRPVVPNIEPGTSRQVAEKSIRDAKLQPGTDDGADVYSDTVPAGTVVSVDPEPGTQLNINERVTLILSKGPEPKPVPDVRNLTRDEAYEMLRDEGFEPYDLPAEFDEEIDGGRVVRTDPPADEEADGDKRVGVVLSNAITVPDVTGQRTKDAEKTLRELGLEVDVESYGGGGGNGQGTVFGLSPQQGTRVEEGARITLYVAPF
jgi:eukaryotic-like serine/threonine-protein kinase